MADPHSTHSQPGAAYSSLPAFDYTYTHPHSSLPAMPADYDGQSLSLTLSQLSRVPSPSSARASEGGGRVAAASWS